MVKEMNEQHYFGDWVVESHLGSGSFGDVYKIKKEEFGVTYYSAMKVIKIPQDKNEQKRLYNSGMDTNSINDYYYQFAKDFIKEIELMAKLQGHTNIVGYNDHIIEQNEDGVGYVIYIRMEFLTPLDSYLGDSNHPTFMAQKEVAKLGIDICNALEICSKMQIIHRDIKPENIFVSPTGDFKIGDFGIARKLEQSQSGLSRKGTINYMAPEVYLGEEYGESVDVYSLGIVLYYLLNCNRVPFLPLYPEQIKYTDSETAFTRRIGGETIPYIKGVDENLNKIIIKACEADPKNRYQTAKELKKDLLEIYPTLSDEPNTEISEIPASVENTTFVPTQNNETVVIGAPVYEDAPVQSEVPEEPAPQPAATPVQTEVPQKSNKKKTAIIIAAVVLALLVAVTAIAKMSSKNKNEVTTTLPVSTTLETETTTTEESTEETSEEESSTTTSTTHNTTTSSYNNTTAKKKVSTTAKKKSSNTTKSNNTTKNSAESFTKEEEEIKETHPEPKAPENDDSNDGGSDDFSPDDDASE